MGHRTPYTARVHAHAAQTVSWGTRAPEERRTQPGRPSLRPDLLLEVRDVRRELLQLLELDRVLALALRLQRLVSPRDRVCRPASGVRELVDLRSRHACTWSGAGLW